MRPLLLALLGLGLAGTPACTSRQILSVEDAPGGGGTTILTTLDVKNYVIWGQAKYVFWECGSDTDGMHCVKRCDVRDDQGDKLLCQSTATFGF